MEQKADTAVIPFFGQPHQVSLEQGFRDHQGKQPSHAACVVLAKYLYLDMECMAMLGMVLASRLVAGLKGASDQNLLR